jgi:hypothetical protein
MSDKFDPLPPTRRGFLATTGSVIAGAVAAPRALSAAVPSDAAVGYNHWRCRRSQDTSRSETRQSQSLKSRSPSCDTSQISHTVRMGYTVPPAIL